MTSDKLPLLCGKSPLTDECIELLQVIDHPDVLLERDGRLLCISLHADLQVEAAVRGQPQAPSYQSPSRVPVRDRPA